MRAFFSLKENRLFAFFSGALFLTSLFFIAPHTEALTLIRLPLTGNTFYYLLFSLLGLGTLTTVLFSQDKLPWKKRLGTLLLICLPAVVVITYGLSSSPEFHLIFQIGVGLYVLLAGALICTQLIAKETQEEQSLPPLSLRDWIKLQGAPTLFLVLFLTGLFFSFGMHRLGQYAAVDEPLWLFGRIEKYWNNLADGELQKTDVSDKPGITVSLISGAGLLVKDPSLYDDKRSQGEIFRKEGMANFFLAFRLPILFFVTLLLPLFYFFLERLIGRSGAVLSYAFLATSPILIGMTKIINPDALLWVFVPLSLLSFLLYKKQNLYRYLFLSGIFLGLGLLTKYIANIVFVYFLGLLFLEYLYHPKAARLPFSEHLRRSLIEMLMLVFASLATFYVLLPAAWVEPKEILAATLSSQAFEKVAPLFLLLIGAVLLDQWLNQTRITGAFFAFLGRFRHWLAYLLGAVFFGSLVFILINVWAGMQPYQFMELLASPKTIEARSDFLGAFLTNFYPLAFAITPLSLLGLLAAPLFFFRQHFSRSASLRLSFYLLIFIVLYYLGATVNSVASIVRYQIIVFPLVAIVSGIGLLHLLRLAEKHFFAGKPKPLTPLLLASLIGLTGFITLLQTPFPLSYASSLLPQKYYIDLKDMGPGSYEIAEQLNALPNAKNLLIWTDKDGVCQFFVGRCKRGNGKESIQDQSYDYLVLSSARESRTTNMIRSRYEQNPTEVVPIHTYYNRNDEAFSVLINGRPSHYVKAFRYEGKREHMTPLLILPSSPEESSPEEES